MEQRKKIEIKMLDSEMKGAYANLMKVTHSKEEFILDFANVFPPKGIVTARVITSPGHLKRIIKALEDNLRSYEKKFGKIEPASGIEEEIGFKP